MQKLLYIPLIFLTSLLLFISCAPETKVNEELSQGKRIVHPEKITCTAQLIADLRYTQDRYTELVMECNILTLQRLDAKVRKLKGQARIDIVILGVQCDNIARLLKEHEAECKNSLTVTGI